MVELIALAAPMGMAVAGECVAQRAGVLTLGLEGGLLMGALAGSLAAVAGAPPEVALAAGGVAGALIGGVTSVCLTRAEADPVVFGLGMNLLALGIAQIVAGRFGAELRSLPYGLSFRGLDVGLLLALLAAGASWFLVSRRAFGLAAKAVGADPDNARRNGLSPPRIRRVATIWCAVWTGLAGATLALFVTHSFTPLMIGGRGYLVLALVALAGWRPLGGAVWALGWAATEAALFKVQVWRPEWTQALPAVAPMIALIFLTIRGGDRNEPRTLGLRFRDAFERK